MQQAGPHDLHLSEVVRRLKERDLPLKLDHRILVLTPRQRTLRVRRRRRPLYHIGPQPL